MIDGPDTTKATTDLININDHSDNTSNSDSSHAIQMNTSTTEAVEKRHQVAEVPRWAKDRLILLILTQ
jgi:hypothetical protein